MDIRRSIKLKIAWLKLTKNHYFTDNEREKDSHISNAIVHVEKFKGVLLLEYL